MTQSTRIAIAFGLGPRCAPTTISSRSRPREQLREVVAFPIVGGLPGAVIRRPPAAPDDA